MSQENVEILRRSLEAFDRRNRTAWIAVRDHDLELVTSGEWPEGDVRGPEAAWDFYIKVADAFERQPYSDDVELVDAAPDKVLAHHRSDVRGSESGADVEVDYWVVVTFRGGKIVRDQWFANHAEALEAAGRSE